MKQLYTKIISLCFFIFLFGNISAQDCSSFAITYTAVASTCQSNGVITVELTGDVSNLKNIQYSLTSATGGTVINPQNSNVMPNLPSGTYTINVVALCGTTPVSKSLTNAKVTGNYKVPAATFNTGSSRKSYDICNTGIIVLNVTNGSGTFTFKITSAPAGVPTGIVTPTKSGSTYKLPGENYPAGEYIIQIEDGCYTSVVTFTLGQVTGFPPHKGTSGTWIDPVLTDNANCSLFSWYVGPMGTNNPDYSRYYSDGMYEVGVAVAGSLPTSWLPWPTNYRVTMDVSPYRFTDFFSPNKLSIFTRLKGCTTGYTSFDVVVTNPSPSTYVASYNCADYDFGIRLRDDFYGMYCYPISIKMTKDSDGSLAFNEPNVAAYTATPFIAKLLYNTAYTRTITDASGKIYNSKINNSRNYITFGSNILACDTWQFPMYFSNSSNNCWPVVTTITDSKGIVVCTDTITTKSATGAYVSCPLKYGEKYTYKVTFPDGYSQSFPKSLASNLPTAYKLALNHSSQCIEDWGYYTLSPYTGQWPIGTVLTLTGPAGFIPQTLTVTSTSSFLYTKSAYYPPGDYTVSADHGCGVPVVSVIKLNGIYSIKDFAFTTEETCDGLKVTPKGSITYQGVAVPTYYRLYAGPAGYDKTVIASGQSIYLTAAGKYKIIAIPTNSATACALNMLEINYDKGPLALDDLGTTAYECADTFEGVILLKGKNGITPYTYQLWDAANTTKLVPDQISSGQVHFNYGQAGQKYTARIIDACGNSFSQELAMSNLSEANIAFANPSNICIGETIQLNCVALGNTTYSWTGPNGFTSNEQNPSIPNAQPGMSGNYTVSVTPQYCGSAITSTVAITVYNAVKAGTVKGNQDVCVRTTPQSLSCDVTGGTGIYTYQWQKSTDGVTGWVNIAGVAGKGVIYTPASSVQSKSDYYRVVATDKCGAVTSAVIRVNTTPCFIPINPHIRSKAGK